MYLLIFTVLYGRYIAGTKLSLKQGDESPSSQTLPKALLPGTLYRYLFSGADS
jgi:hypothetical protein